VEDTVVTFTGRWDAEELWRRASPRFRESTKREDLGALLDAARSALGPLTEYGGARGEAMMSVSNLSTVVSANYVAKGRFQNGDAEFRISMIKVGPTWMIEGFQIGSPLLMRSLVGVKS